MPLKIAIIGGGPCGLTLARLLECKGIDYIVYEQDASDAPSRTGGTLDIHEQDGQRVLREAKLWDEFKKYARWEDDVFTLLDNQSKQWLRLGEERDGGSEGGRPEIDRMALRQILLNSIPKDKVQWGFSLKSVTRGKNDKPVLEFANGLTAFGFDLVVGTDGAWSKLRPSITQVKPSYSGKHYIEFRTNLDNPIYGAVVDRFGAGTIAVLAGATQMAIQRQGDGSYRTYLGIPCPEDFTRTTVDLADVEGTRRLFLSAEFFGGWAEGFKELIRTGTNWRSWPLYHLPVDAVHWEPVTGLTLAGDAAHLALPNGDGVNVAMYDSLVLANKISEYGITDLSRAVREYEEDMFVRGQQSITDGIQLWEKMAHPDGAEGFCKYMKAKVGEEFETLVKN